MEDESEPTGDKTKVFAIASLVVGIFGLGAWCIPLCGAPLSLLGMGLAIFGLTGRSKVPAGIGLAFNLLALVASIVNAVGGAAMMMQRTHPLTQPPPAQHAPADPAGASTTTP